MGYSRGTLDWFASRSITDLKESGTLGVSGDADQTVLHEGEAVDLNSGEENLCDEGLRDGALPEGALAESVLRPTLTIPTSRVEGAWSSRLGVVRNSISFRNHVQLDQETASGQGAISNTISNQNNMGSSRTFLWGEFTGGTLWYVRLGQGMTDEYLGLDFHGKNTHSSDLFYSNHRSTEG